MIQQVNLEMMLGYRTVTEYRKEDIRLSEGKAL